MSQAWLKQGERSTGPALRAIRWIATRLGRAPARLLLYPITAYYLVATPASRRCSRRFLQRATGRPPGLLAVARHFFTFASVILDRVYLLSGREDLLDVAVEGVEDLEALADRGRGGLLIGAHFGSFEVLRALAPTRGGLDIRVLMRRQQNARLTALLDELNPAVARSVIDLDDPSALLRVSEAVAEGTLVGMLGDRTVARDPMIRCRFLGASAPFPIGPMRLAAVLGVPVIQFFGIYEGGNRYRIRFEVLAHGASPPPEKRRRWVEAMTRCYVRRLERQVRRHPENWFNFYDFWYDEQKARGDDRQ